MFHNLTYKDIIQNNKYKYPPFKNSTFGFKNLKFGFKNSTNEGQKLGN